MYVRLHVEIYEMQKQDFHLPFYDTDYCNG